MSATKFSLVALAILLSNAASLPAHAQIPVTDVGAIMQLVMEVNTLEQQLNTARQDLGQAQQQYQSSTGGRGMGQLLSGTVRNYLPTNWPQLQAAMQGQGGGFALGSDVRGTVATNAVLNAQQVAALSQGSSSTLSLRPQIRRGFLSWQPGSMSNKGCSRTNRPNSMCLVKPLRARNWRGNNARASVASPISGRCEACPRWACSARALTQPPRMSVRPWAFSRNSTRGLTRC